MTLNRPASMNSLTLEMDKAYRSALRAAEAEPTVRAIVVTGAGRAFCAGADVAGLEILVGDPERPHFDGSFGEPLMIDKPLIAAINGGCVGLGLILALMCDVRFVADDAKISTAFAQRGVVAEQGSCTLLRHIVGEANARDLLLSSRMILGDEAVRVGLATRAVPRNDVVAVAIEYAAELAESCAPGALATIKAQLRAGLLVEYRREADEALILIRQAFAGPDFMEGIASYREKRRPNFRGVPRSSAS